ncbi:MAG: enoyl-CoA hydratase/isomerase family protein [Hyphomicrobiales bacterium]|nr:MAG: enoyl-CoA hydratase/isomerase family protein [Hyphomicrobiales bacterium]
MTGAVVQELTGTVSGDVVRLETDGPVATVVVARPEMRNALSPAVIAGLNDAVRRLRESDVRAVVVCGEGPHFCAGADISAALEVSTEAEARSFIARFQEAFRAISTLPQPVIAAVEGYALGGGCELALWCDIRVVSETARLGVPEVKIGALPAAGGTQMLTRLAGRSVALEMLLLGDPITGERAHQLGLATSLVPAGETRAAATEMARRLAGLAPLAMTAMKQCVQADWMPLTDALELERRLGAELFATEDRREGMSAFLEKRTANFSAR